MIVNAFPGPDPVPVSSVPGFAFSRHHQVRRPGSRITVNIKRGDPLGDVDDDDNSSMRKVSHEGTNQSDRQTKVLFCFIALAPVCSRA